ncbi:MAG TPA: acyl-CoA dehydrogenase family protein [Myxococcota bacterium]|nr:acyl-CoA dehydrogenase family protein [Myxococcota bacterium]
MDFGLSDEQKLLQETIRKLLADVFPPARAREVSKTASAHDPETWKLLAENGALGVLVPESEGGSGLSFLDAMLVAEEVGRAAGPGAYVATAVMGAIAAAHCGEDALRGELASQIASGSTRIGVGLAEVTGARDGAGVKVASGRLEGTALFVLDAVGADRLLVYTPDGLALVSAAGPGVEVIPLSAVDGTRRYAEARLRRAEARALLPGALPRVIAAGQIALAFDSLGASERALELAVGYAAQRKQFGRVIGSFQAVKHMLAEIAAALEPARSLCWYAAHVFDHEPDESARYAALCKAHVSEVASEVLRKATEVHGGIGFTEQYDLHLWFRRVALTRPLLGGPELLREHALRLRGPARSL